MKIKVQYRAGGRWSSDTISTEIYDVPQLNGLKIVKDRIDNKIANWNILHSIATSHPDDDEFFKPTTYKELFAPIIAQEPKKFQFGEPLVDRWSAAAKRAGMNFSIHKYDRKIFFVYKINEHEYKYPVNENYVYDSGDALVRSATYMRRKELLEKIDNAD